MDHDHGHGLVMELVVVQTHHVVQILLQIIHVVDMLDQYMLEELW